MSASNLNQSFSNQSLNNQGLNEQGMPILNFVVALACEAKPLIDFYRLTKVADKPFSFFQSKEVESMDGSIDTKHSPQINLVVSGIGLQDMAMACGWLGAQNSGADRQSIWLNVGTAGHRSLAVGEIAIVARCSDINGARDYYPPQVAKWPEQSISVLSNNAPCTEYPESDAVDMEASAFFRAANKLSNAELIQSLKIISDNIENDINTLSAAIISQLVAAKMKQINHYTSNLLDIAAKANSFTKATDEFLHGQLSHLHVTVSEFQQYRDLTNKLENIGVANERLTEMATKSKSMKDLLAQLRSIQESTPPDLSQLVAAV